MAINKTKYDGIHYQVTVMNMTDGTVQVHGAGCADLKRGKVKFAEPSQADEVWDCIDQEDIREAYNADFDEETDGWYDMTWMPCAKHVPARTDYVADAVEKAQAEEPATGEMLITTGRKWTYIYAGDGSLIAEVRNDSVAAVLAALQA